MRKKSDTNDLKTTGFLFLPADGDFEQLVGEDTGDFLDTLGE